ncbi:MAG: hypothetical protein HQK50_01815 [Oligoflexia bacterium]|nr:hypothetical protein [Oligoflexia bacterium]MBF0364274.1 hypothetical protein [Oligoflexia bacterium]
MVLRVLLASMLMGLTTSIAFAGILLEPYLGKSLNGKGDTEYELLGLKFPYKHSYDSITYGGRVGADIQKVQFGVDYSMQNFSLESEYSGAKGKDKVAKTQTGVFLGYGPQPWLRIWGLYIFESEVEGKDPLNAAASVQFVYDQIKFSKGGGYGIGVGLMPNQYISINIEYRAIEYDEETIRGLTVTNMTNKFDLSELLVSVSLPFIVLK